MIRYDLVTKHKWEVVMALTGFDHLVVRVKDIEAGIATYRDGLGLELERTDE